MAKSEVREQATPTQPEKKPPRFGMAADGTSSPAGLIIKIAVLAVVLGIAVWAALPLLADQRWVGLAIVVLVTALLFYIYLSPRRVPAKYLIPGTLFLIVFQIVPVLYTMSTAFTNFGDAHRGSKQDAISAIEGTSVQQVPGTPEYVLSLATEETRQPGTSSSSSPTRPPSSRSLVPRRGWRSWPPTTSKWGQTARSWKRRATPSSTSARRVPVPRTSRSSACRPTGAPSRTRGCPGPSRGPPAGL